MHVRRTRVLQWFGGETIRALTQAMVHRMHLFGLDVVERQWSWRQNAQRVDSEWAGVVTWRHAAATQTKEISTELKGAAEILLQTPID